MGVTVDDMDVQYYTQRLVIGYDDLLDYNNGRPVYKRYGQNWIINCRVKAWDTNYVDPTGERDEKERIMQNDVQFRLTMFSDDTFNESEHGNYH